MIWCVCVYVNTNTFTFCGGESFRLFSLFTHTVSQFITIVGAYVPFRSASVLSLPIVMAERV